MSNSGRAQLQALHTKLAQLIDQVATSAVSFPALDEVRTADDPLEAQHPSLALVSATLGEMKALVGGPRYVFESAFSFHVSSCLRVAIEAHVEETLRESGKPLAAEEIAKSSCINPDKLARVLRLLAANSIFVEVEPGVFARNYCSSILDTGKSVQMLQADPVNAYNDTNGFAALIAHAAEEGFKSSAYAADVLLSTDKANSYAPSDSAFSSAFDGQTAWEYFGANERLMRRFAAGMAGFSKICSAESETALAGFPWKDLPDDSVVVDVGGGTGNLCLAIGTELPNLKFVVQDRKEVIEQAAPGFWESSATPELRARVTLQAHDFFSRQQVHGPAVYVLRAIIHDWADEESIRILTHLKNAAAADTKLVVIESTLVELSPPNQFPPVNTFPYLSDMQMMVALNAQERTEAGYKALGEKAGWRLKKVWKTGPQGQDGTWRHYEFELM